MLEIRKIVSFVEDVHREGERSVSPSIRAAVVSVVMTNPWSNSGYVEDLYPIIRDLAPKLADLMVPELISIMGGPDHIEAYGKSGVVGLDGEIEHASALIHTLHFGNVLRNQAQGSSYIASTNKRAPAGTSIVVPMIHKTDRAERSHFLTVETSIPDAPRANELVITIAASSGGRPFARIGNRKLDIEAGIG